MLITTEVGKIIVYSTEFDLSDETSLTLTLTAPDATEATIADSRITAPATSLNTDLGQLPASTYMQFITEVGDFTQAGTYKIYGKYVDATKTFYGLSADIEVTAKGN